MNNTQYYIDSYNFYINRTKDIGFYNKGNSDEYWGNIESSFYDLQNLLMHSNKDDCFFDLGCGAGQVMYFLKMFGYKNINGVELNSDLYDYCKEQGFNVYNEDMIKSEMNYLKKADLIYFYCPIKDDFLKKELLNKICNKMKIGAIIYAKLCEIEGDNFKQLSFNVYKKIK